MAKNVFSTSYDLKEAPNLKKKLEEKNFKFSATNHAVWQAKGNALTVTLYNSGKLLIQGWGADLLAQELLFVGKQVKGLEHIKNLDSWIGTDEAGKGDFFGPLVTAAVYVNREKLKDLLLLEVQDSKSMTDRKIIETAQNITETFVHSILTIEPKRYNQLYQQYKNLNKLLAWAHASVIERLLEKVNCRVVLSDQFGDENLIRDALSHKQLGITLVQQTQAEANPAVAAASILARYEFLNQLAKLTRKYSINFPKGVSEQVVQAGKLFNKQYGVDRLNEVAKIHFKTIQKI